MKVLAWLALLLTMSGMVVADERILKFDSDITIHSDGAMTVRETIQVRCENKEIKHGIYRDLPTQYKDLSGRRCAVDYEFVSVTRDGKPEEYRRDGQPGRIRFYFGKKDATLRPGTYTYVFTYKTDHQIGFFARYDELYWNATGTKWGFPIDAATVTVRLPQPVPASDLRLDAYTGPEGSKGTNYESEVQSPGVAWFATSRLLNPQEGITVCVGFPKGVVKEPTKSERMAYLVRSNLGVVAGLAGLMLVILYYIIVWAIVGKDPAPGPILPRETPPEGLSPAAVRYLWRMRYDTQTFTAALVSLATKGRMRIEEAEGKFFLARDKSRMTPLAREEAAIERTWARCQGDLEISQKNRLELSQAITACKEELKQSIASTYFVANKKYFIVGLVISIVVAAAAALGSIHPGAAAPAVFMCVWLTGWTAGVSVFTMTVVGTWRAVFKGVWGNLPSAIVLTIIVIPFYFGECMGIFFMSTIVSPEVMGILILLGVLNLVFFQLLKAPTALGRKALDEIEGFRAYLRGEPHFGDDADLQRSSKLFENYLAYAIALDEEKHWSKQFNEAIGRAGMTTRDRSLWPDWYRGDRWQTSGATGLAAGLGGAFAGSIAAASTAPSSASGGGGGGSSGGGGGGGGGGGW